MAIPDWAAPAVAKADPKHRLEGLIISGVYDVRPGADAVATLVGVDAAASGPADRPDRGRDVADPVADDGRGDPALRLMRGDQPR